MMAIPARTAGDQKVALGLLQELLRKDRDLIERARGLTLQPNGRGWIRVADTAEADAWLIAWSPATSVGTHDHGDSHGAVHVLRGALVERYWENDEPEARARVRRLVRGDTVQVPPGRVHDVANVAVRPALSLHVYAPRLTTMGFYLPTSR